MLINSYMKKIMVLTLLIPFFSLLINNTNDFFFKPIDVEKKLCLKCYLGLWHQVATSESTTLFGTGPKFTKVSAIYHPIKSEPNTSNISVLNFGFDSNNSFSQIEGYSYSPPNELTTKRKVKFNSVIFEGSYWIVKLGPIIKNDYQYAVISGPLTPFIGTRFSLYVLARNRTEYDYLYKDEVKNWCSQNGFIYPWNKYIETF